MIAAVLSAFLLYTITQLQPNSADISKDILLRISLQLGNSSVSPYVEPPFFVPTTAAIVNALLFTSLALVLLDAFLAVLTRTWLRDFDRGWRSSNVPEERASAREMRLQGLKRWKLPWVVALLPLLIQASLILFGVALIVMLFDLHRPTACAALTIFAAGVLFYVSTTVISALDTNAPFTNPFTKALQVLINVRWSPVYQVFLATLLRRNWPPGRTTRKGADGGQINGRMERTETHLAIYNRLYAATSKAVENLPVFTALFDQWVHAPTLRPQSMTDWHPILSLIRPYLSNTSLGKEYELRPVARLLLSFNRKEQKGQQAVLEALREHGGDSTEPPSIEQLYIHLLHPADPDWSLASQMVLKLECDNNIIIELRWILNWITFRFLDQSQEFPNSRDSSWVSSMRSITPFLRSAALYIIQNRIVNNDHRPFDLLLHITRSIAHGFNEVDERQPSTKLSNSQTSPEAIYGELFIPTKDFLVPPESRWEFIRGLYAASSKSAAGRNREFTLIIILLMIGTLSAVEPSHIDTSSTYKSFINFQKDLPVLMDGLWETWQAHDVDHYLLTGIAVRLLNQSSDSFHKPSLDTQQSNFQDLLTAYDSHMSDAVSLLTPGACEFIGAALSLSLKLFNWGMPWEPRTLELKNPWLVMHIHNILRWEWRMPGSTMREAVWGRVDLPNLLERFDLLERDHQVDQVNDLREHEVDQLLNHLLNQQIDLQIKELLDRQIRQIRQIEQLLQSYQQIPPQLLEQHLRECHQQHLQQRQIRQKLHQMLPHQLQQLQQLPQQLQQQLQQFQQFFPQLKQLFPQLFQKIQELPQEYQLLLQKLKRKQEQRGEEQQEHGSLQVVVQELLPELQEVLQALISLPPGDPPLPPLDPPLPSLDPVLPSPDPPLPSLPPFDPPGPLSQIDTPLPSLSNLQTLFPSQLQHMISIFPPQFRQQFKLLEELDEQIGRINELSKQQDYQLFEQRDQLLEQLHKLQVQCANWLQQWQPGQQRDQQRDQQLEQRLDQQERLRQLKLGQLKQQLKQLDLQRSTTLETIARRRLELYNTKELPPDLVALSLFLSPRNKDIFNNSRRLILECFRSTPSEFPLSLANATGIEVGDSEVAGLICSDFFDSNAIGALTKWRLLANVVLPEWETLSTPWKDSFATEVLKVDGAGGDRVDWMARVTPLLEGEFNLYEFGVSNHATSGSLTPTHLRMVATAVEHLGAGGLAHQTVHELEDFLEGHSNILNDTEALDRIRTVTRSQQNQNL